MATGEWISALRELAGKYRSVLAVIGLGILLLLLPQGTKQAPTQPAATQTAQSQSLQESLARTLSAIEGAGKVEVLLSQATGERTTYQTDGNTQTTSDTESRKSETVLITDQSRAQAGLIRQVDPPVYLGAIVVCQGADRAALRLAIVEAVMDVTGLTSDKITVLKMK